MTDPVTSPDTPRTDAEFEGLLAQVVVAATQLGISESQENRLIYGSREVRRTRLASAEYALRQRHDWLLRNAGIEGEGRVCKAITEELGISADDR